MDSLSANPFVVQNNLTILDKVKFTLLFPLAVIRILLCIFFAFLVMASSYICYFIQKKMHPTDFYRSKLYYMWLPVFFYRCAAFCLGFISVNVISLDNPRARGDESEKLEAPIILLVPHTSAFDTFVVAKFYYLTAVARFQILDAPFVSRLARLNNPILVQRDDPTSRRNVINDIIDRTVNRHEQVLILPEGTNGNQEFVIKLKNGAFTPGLPVQPLVVKYNLNDWFFNDIDHVSWTWEGPSLTKLIYMSSCKLWTSMTVLKLPVYKPSVEEKSNPTLYASNVHRFICESARMRQSTYSFDDVRLLPLCLEAGIPRSPCCIKFVKMCKRIAEEAHRFSEQVGQVPNVNADTMSLGSNRSTENTAIFNERSAIKKRVVDVVTFVRDNSIVSGSQALKGKEDIVEILGINAVPTVVNSSSIEDFYVSLSGVNRAANLKVKQLLVVLILCDTRQTNLWDRIKSCVELLTSEYTEPILTIDDFKGLVWLLLGLEHQVIPNSVFENSRISFEYLQQNLVPLFKRAVKENASGLLVER